MNLTTKIIIAFFILFGKPIFAQTSSGNTNVNRLISKEWRLVSFEEEDGKFEPSPDQIGDRMKFELNHKVEYIEFSKYKVGIWRYDYRNKVLTIINDDTKEKELMKVVRITNTDLVLEYNSDGSPLKMYMAAVTNRKKR